MNWGRLCDDVRWRANAYAGYYDLDLYSNFTYFLEDPVNGDQFRQSDQRVFFGGEISATLENRSLFGAETDYTIGFQTRNDVIWDLELARTRARADVNPIRTDDVITGNYSLFAGAETKWNDWFRTEAGMRADLFYFDVDSDNPANSGNEWDGIAVPKLNFIFGPWNDHEYYLNLGGGFHSNDARGLFTRIDPNDGLTTGSASTAKSRCPKADSPTPRLEPLSKTRCRSSFQAESPSAARPARTAPCAPAISPSVR
jgi:hypothetical protein